MIISFIAQIRPDDQSSQHSGENVLENEPTHLIMCSKVRDGSILPTQCDWRKDAVFLE